MFGALPTCKFLVTSIRMLWETRHCQCLCVSDFLSSIYIVLTFLAPSIFGRDLTEQVRADSKYEERQVPVIVEKCIEAVEARGELSLVTLAMCILIRSKHWNMKEFIEKLEAQVNRNPSLRCLNEGTIPLSIFAMLINSTISAA